MFSSVRWPLALAFFLLVSFGVGATEMVVFGAVRHYCLRNVEEDLTRDCRLIANLMQRHMDQTALTPLERKLITDEMSRLSLGLSGRLCVVNWQGQVLEDSARQSGEIVANRAEVQAALHGATQMTIRGLDSADDDEDQSVGEPSMYVAVPLLARGAVAGAIYGQCPLTDVQLMLFKLEELLYETALVWLALALLLSLLMSRWLTKPLRRLSDVVTRFGEGHVDERSQLKSRDEIGALSRAFNEMADHLELQHLTLLQFVSDASHELKTPLACLRSLFEALESGALEQPETRQKFLGHIHREMDRMEKLVADLLELHKLDRAALGLRLETLALKPFLTELAEDYAGRVPLALECPDEARAQADPDRLRQVLVNLVENARRAVSGQNDPKVRLRVAGGDSHSHIWVEDNGTGITREHLKRVFDRFYRVDKSRVREGGGGTGLGLAITRGLVEAMGGRITADSAGEGRGASFCVTLPKL